MRDACGGLGDDLEAVGVAAGSRRETKVVTRGATRLWPEDWGGGMGRG